MTTATKSKPSAVSKVYLDYVEADNIVLSHDPNVPFSWEETEVLRRAGIIDTNEITGGLGRATVVNQAKAILPPLREREANQVALTKAKSARNQALPELEAKRAEIEASISALNVNVDEARAIVQRDAALVDRLRLLAPAFIRKEYEIRLEAETFDLRVKRSDIETQLTQIETLVNTAAIDQQAVLHLQAVGMTHLIKRRQAGGMEYVDDGDWRRYVEQRVEERPALLAARDKVESELAAVTRRCEKLLDYYVDQVG